MNILNLIDPETLSEALGGIVMAVLAVGPFVIGGAIERLRGALGRRADAESAGPRTVVGRAGVRR